MTTKTPFSLSIKSDKLAAWMPINNTFAMSPLENHVDASHGVLIQLGKYKRSTDELPMECFGKVEFTRNGETVSIGKDTKKKYLGRRDLEDPNAVWWINVHNAGDQAMRPDQLDELRLDPARSLHKYFIPYRGGITIWPGIGPKNGGQLDLRMTSEKTGGRARFPRYEFATSTPVEVEVYRNGVLFDTPTIDAIVVSEHETRPRPGENHNPPQYP